MEAAHASDPEGAQFAGSDERLHGSHGHLQRTGYIAHAKQRLHGAVLFQQLPVVLIDSFADVFL